MPYPVCDSCSPEKLALCWPALNAAETGGQQLVGYDTDISEPAELRIVEATERVLGEAGCTLTNVQIQNVVKGEAV
jgi:hypothetical protein